MSANAGVLRGSELIGCPAQETAWGKVAVLCKTSTWNPEDFGREQIRGLVRRVFFTSGAPAVKQVVFSAAGPNTDVAHICDQVGRALALETSAPIAIVGHEPRVGEMMRAHLRDKERTTIKACSLQMAFNLWHVPEFRLGECGEEPGTGPYWISGLAELRNEFEYAVIHGPAAGTSSEAALLGQLADGIILVLGANSTRRATARKIKETLEAGRSRILGTVLSERRFPVPEQIYRRL